MGGRRNGTVLKGSWQQKGEEPPRKAEVEMLQYEMP